MKCFLWEHLECTNWNIIVVLWILLGAVALGQVRQYDLDMPFGSKCATLKQGYLRGDTSLIYVFTSCHVVQSIRDYRQSFKELISEDMIRCLMHFVQSCNYITL